MKVSIDGLRRNLNGSVEQLKDIVFALKEDIGSENFIEICEALNEVIQDSNILNCVFNPDCNDDFTDMSDLRVEFIDVDEL